jgi:hypothetical protein
MQSDLTCHCLIPATGKLEANLPFAEVMAKMERGGSGRIFRMRFSSSAS